MRSTIACFALLMASVSASPATAQTCDLVAAARAAEGRPWTGESPMPSPSSYEVGHGVSAPILKTFVSPVYPPNDMARRFGGSVGLLVVVGTDGQPLSVQSIRGGEPPSLVQAAKAAVNQWKFTPGEWNGHPVPVHMTVEIHFDRVQGTTGACLE